MNKLLLREEKWLLRYELKELTSVPCAHSVKEVGLQYQGKKDRFHYRELGSKS